VASALRAEYAGQNIGRKHITYPEYKHWLCETGFGCVEPLSMGVRTSIPNHLWWSLTRTKLPD